MKVSTDITGGGSDFFSTTTKTSAAVDHTTTTTTTTADDASSSMMMMMGGDDGCGSSVFSGGGGSAGVGVGDGSCSGDGTITTSSLSGKGGVGGGGTTTRTTSTATATNSTSTRTLPSRSRSSKGGSSTFIRPKSYRVSQNQADEVLSELTINKLEFSKLDRLYGRDKESKILMNSFQRIISPTTTTTTSCTNSDERTADGATTTTNDDDDITCCAGSGSGASNRNGSSSSSSSSPTFPSPTLQQQSKTRELVLISGYSGTGKSTFIKHQLEIVTKTTHNGFYITGKFDFQQHDIPYSGIISACNELCEQIENIDERCLFPQRRSLTNGSTGRRKSLTFHQIQTKLLKEFHTEKQLLIRIIPGLRRIFGFHNNESSSSSSSSDDNDDGNEKKKGDDELREEENEDDTEKENEDKEEDDESTGDLFEARNRFNFAFRRLMRVIASFGPLVLVLDDLQWSDVASLDLLETIITDPDNSGIMIVGCYRSNEVTPTHLVSKMLRDLRKISTTSSAGTGTTMSSSSSSQHHQPKKPSSSSTSSILNGKEGEENASSSSSSILHMEEIHIGDMKLDDINQMLGDLLRCDIQKTYELACIVHKKTQGNIFYVVQLLLTLQRDVLLEFSIGLMTWCWDIQKIESTTQASINVVDLVRTKIVSDLPISITQKLPIAACLGSTFDLDTFELVSNVMMQENELSNFMDDTIRPQKPELSTTTSPTTTVQHPPVASDTLSTTTTSEPTKTSSSSSWVDLCIEDGLIVTSGSSHYRWAHDKVQEAALALVKEEHRHSFAYRIGTVLLDQLSPAKLQKMLFVTVNLLNVGVEHDASSSSAAAMNSIPKSKRIQLSQLNLQAGQRAIQFCAFDAAAKYLEIALQLLPPNHWNEYYQLSIAIYTSLADAEFCLSNFDRMNELCNEIFHHQTDHPLEDTFHAHRLVCESLNYSGKYVEAEKACLSALKMIGCTFPKSDVMRTFATITGVLKAKKLIERATEDDIRKLNRCTDPTKKFGLRIMETLAQSAMVTGSKIVALPLLRQLEWVWEYGYTDETNLIFGGVALVMTSILGELKVGKKISDFGQIIYDQTQARRTVARHMTCTWGLTLHLMEPLSMCMKECLKGYQVGIEMGDFLYGMWDVQLYLQLAQRSGKSLIALEDDYTIYANHMEESGQKPVYTFAIAHWQAIQNLMGLTESERPIELTGDVMNETEFLKQEKEANNNSAIFLVQNRRLYLGCFFGEHKLSANIALEMGEKFYQDSPGWPSFIDQFLYGALSCISAYRSTKKRKYLVYAKHQVKKINAWLKAGSPNFLQWKFLLDAELASLQQKKKGKKFKKVKELFETGIKAAARMGHIQEQALIRERYAEYLLRTVKDEEDATYQLKQACALYDEWGAKAKVRQMWKLHDNLMVFPDEISMLE